LNDKIEKITPISKPATAPDIRDIWNSLPVLLKSIKIKLKTWANAKRPDNTPKMIFTVFNPSSF